MAFTGRRIIYSDENVITSDNLLTVLRDSIGVHSANRIDIEYLYKYYKGEQPILYRKKDIRPEINNKIVINRANEIVSFKTGYLMGEPVQYVARGENQQIINKINTLNDYMYSEDKASKDMSLATWFYICGTAYRMITIDPVDDEDEAPFEIYTLDPRNTFVVYENGLGNKPLMGVTYVIKSNGDMYYSIYTRDTYYEVYEDKIVKEQSHTLGEIPIVEYPANDARIGAFEIVITLLDAINTTQSNRLDGLEQFVQSLMVLKGVDIDSDEFALLRQAGGLKIPLDADVFYLVQELNQVQNQTLIDDMYQTVLTICGMPSQSDGSGSDSSNNGAVIVRNGWQQAEARAMDSERMFKESEKNFLKIAINICNTLRDTDFKISNIDIRFTRRNYENILQKSQVLISMLSNDKIAPQLAFSHSGLFVDPDLAYSLSEKYRKEQEKKAEKMMLNNNNPEEQNNNNFNNEKDKEEQ